MIRSLIFSFFCCLTFLFGASGFAAAKPIVEIQTSQGNVTLELDSEKAPRTVENFLSYARAGFYNGTIFHRVIPGFMIQGGGFTEDMRQKQTRAPIPNEADNRLKNQRGTVAMARTGEPHSATAQFFINLVDNPFLDFSAPAGNGWGYAVFGQVVQGMDVVDTIARSATGSAGQHQDVPRQPILIQSVRIVSEK
ncbi:MAG: peptidyl-prolyl cis-trans isomerase [Zoogloeaceae bacterium]|jgi:cyclophilin family peptidyl-prolyl cis-trans isomerase|nr:peptidyl-prolyl cis-trans isomerase [Zoogloeaceae bacterium]